MPKITHNHYTLEQFAKEYNYTIEDILHVAANGDLVLSIHSNKLEFAYGKIKSVDNDFYSALCERKNISGFVNLIKPKAAELEIYKEISCYQFESDLAEYDYLYSSESQNITINDLYITRKNADLFLTKNNKKISHNISTAKSSEDFRVYFRNLLKASKKEKLKNDYWNDAKTLFPNLSNNNFRVVWDEETKNCPEWRQAGRPKKIIQK